MTGTRKELVKRTFPWTHDAIERVREATKISENPLKKMIKLLRLNI
jgi:hypothetical protein